MVKNQMDERLLDVNLLPREKLTVKNEFLALHLFIVNIVHENDIICKHELRILESFCLESET